MIKNIYKIVSGCLMWRKLLQKVIYLLSILRLSEENNIVIFMKYLLADFRF